VVGNGHKVAAKSVLLHSASSLAGRLVGRSKFLNLRYLNCKVTFSLERQDSIGAVPDVQDNTC
jgi:hypothetical protein